MNDGRLRCAGTDRIRIPGDDRLVSEQADLILLDWFVDEAIALRSLNGTLRHLPQNGRNGGGIGSDLRWPNQ
ncbi:hypothetical protein [Stieleria marina]|uniref:hypothetical protein n=1 Tax=Stieleria marina TaxID=1930275 RepID=UPI003AF350A4